MRILPGLRRETRDASWSTVPAPGGGAVWAGERVTNVTAMYLPAVWGAVSLISRLTSTLPLDTFTKTDGARREVPRPKVLTRPSALPMVRWTGWLGGVMWSLLLNDNAYGRVLALAPGGSPEQVELLDPAWVQVIRKGLGPVTYKVGNEDVDAASIWHVAANIPPGAATGAATIEYAKQAIGLGLAVQRYGSQWYGEGGHPTTVLHSDVKLDMPTAKMIKERFLDASRKTREPIVLGSGMAVERIQDGAGDSDLVAAWDAVRTDVASYFNLDPGWLGGSVGGAAITYANVEQRLQLLATVTLQPWVVVLEEALADLVRSGIYVKLNLDALVRADLLTRTSVAGSRIRAGITNVDHERALLDLAPLPNGEGERYLWPPYRAFPSDGDDPVAPAPITP